MKKGRLGHLADAVITSVCRRGDSPRKRGYKPLPRIY